MRNLALQGEIRHIVPYVSSFLDAHVAGTLSDPTSATSPGKIVAVIPNSATDFRHHVHVGGGSVGDDNDFQDNDGRNASERNEESCDDCRSNLPPANFVVTSDGIFYALDSNDRLVWLVDLEKVVMAANEDDDDEEAEGPEVTAVQEQASEILPRSKWFYASSFLYESSPEDDLLDNEANSADGMNADMGMDLNNQGGLHVTCLSHAGHIVSVSIDATNSLAKNGGIVEDGSECIGSFENGLESGGWSPDGEVLALVTFASEADDEAGAGDNLAKFNATNSYEEAKIPILMTMNTQYEILSEIRLDPCLVPTHDEPNNSPTKSINPNTISLCWRPDSSSLALSTMDAPLPTDRDSTILASTTPKQQQPKPHRRIRTFHRTTLQLLSLSKEEDGSGRDVPNLLPVTPTWAPAGCSHYVGAVQSSRPLIGGSGNSGKNNARSRPVSLQVAFMEPNGLRHRECKIHDTRLAGKNGEKEEVIGIAFNLEGDLLAVVSLLTPADSESSTQHKEYGKVQLYHRSNYHWYLKYELRFDDKVENEGVNTSGSVSVIKFSDEDPYRLMIALDRRGSTLPENALEWREYAFRWESSTIHYSQHTIVGKSPNSPNVLALSIDGKTLNFTPLDKAIVPPPMYAASLELPAPVIGITSRPCFQHEITGNNSDDSNNKPSHEEEMSRVELIVALADGSFALLKNGVGKSKESLTPGFSPPTLLTTFDLSTLVFSNKMEGGDISPEYLAFNGMKLRDMTIIDASEDSFTIIAASSPQGTRGRHHFHDNLVEIKISWASLENGERERLDLQISACVPLKGRVLRIVNWSDTALVTGARWSALIELADGMLLDYFSGGMVDCSKAGALLEPCPWLAGLYDAKIDTTSLTPSADVLGHDEPSKRLAFGLSSRYRLYCGERLLSSASTSFAVSLEHKFLSHITLGSRPQQRFLPLASLRDFDPFMGSDENEALDGYEARSVERGARLIAIFPMKPMCVIQMPRGNLESISPRALVLPYIMMKIDEGDYFTALDIMRRQRVDMNLIVDLDPFHFLEKGGAELFIGQIDKIDNINLFLSSLIDVDTTIWKYPIPSWRKKERRDGRRDETSKVNLVCTKMREVMIHAENKGITSSGKIVKEGHFLLPILSSYAKQNPPMLEEALALIKSNAPKNLGNQSKRKSVLLSESVQSSIQYLAFLADYELIFNTAIGMYDFDLAKAVARHSQMDPKVYLPMLKRWREMPDSMARYEVDVKLKRYESALRHLVAAGRDEDQTSNAEHISKCLKFIESQGLHKLGLELFANESEFLQSIMVSLGERLLTENRAEEALTVFLATSPKCIDGGKRAASACGDWRAYFACCAEGSDSADGDDSMTSISVKIAENISSRGGNMNEQRDCYASAARILLDYGKDVGYAVDMFISGHMYNEGRRISYLHKRTDLVKKCVDAAVSYANTCIEDLAERASSFEVASKRYYEVIKIRRQAIKEAEEAGIDPHLDDSASLFSMQSTASNSSLRSTASGSSVGSTRSVASVSTVISVGATSTFSFTGDVDTMKHKSKFNKIGRDKPKKKKKKKGPAARRMKPGSEEELKSLVDTLKFSIPNDPYLVAISETVTFLMQSGKSPLAKLLFQAYEDLSSAVTKEQKSRSEKDKQDIEERGRFAHIEGRIDEFAEHDCEKDVNELECKFLPESIRNIFSFLS
mmetsp:Transcript_17532/g.36805  ORF Transcript_17532/g.36805 Transcript_17532/m.36805 type:complete len:1678 (-) Transcript_17532:61-5094(-)